MVRVRKQVYKDILKEEFIYTVKQIDDKKENLEYEPEESV
jgi:hypothetical protein